MGRQGPRKQASKSASLPQASEAKTWIEIEIIRTSGASLSGRASGQLTSIVCRGRGGWPINRLRQPSYLVEAAVARSVHGMLVFVAHQSSAAGSLAILFCLSSPKISHRC